MAAWRYEISFLVLKNILLVRCSHSLNIFACTKGSKLIDFNFRFLHRRLATNNFLQKIGIREDGTCTFCHDKKEDMLHLFWGCEKARIFWDDLSIWLQACHMLSKENHLGMETALGLKPDDSNFKLQIIIFFA